MKKKKKKNKRPILFATDFSRASGAALQQAIALAKTKNAELVIAHVLVYPGPMASEGMVFPQVYQELEAQIRKDATRRLASLLEKVKKSSVRATAVMPRGVPHQEITRLARSRNAELIVVGTHGRTGFSRLVVGSVAGRVVAAASCPVLTVR
jgi:universal stress protein A